MAVTVGHDTSILYDAIAEVRQIVPGASINEVLRLAALIAIKGEREARRIVFAVREDIRLAGDRLPLALTPYEKTILKEAKESDPNFNLSEAVRFGLAKLAREDDNDKIAVYIAREKTGRPRKTPPGEADNPDV